MSGRGLTTAVWQPGPRERANVWQSHGVKRCRLHVTGASGSGTTTLGRVLAATWGTPHADTDDYFWRPTRPPFTEKRAETDRVALMHEIFVPREAWVLSGSMVGWGSDVMGRFDAVVFLTLDSDVRMQRLKHREHARRGVGPVDEAAVKAFFEWASKYEDPDFDGRSRVTQEAWLSTLTCPVLRLVSSATPEALRDRVVAWEPST